MRPIILLFLTEIGSGSIEVYNEFSLEHELGIYLRERLGERYKIQFERPVNYFSLLRKEFEKKEIDISIFSPDKVSRQAIELKFPQAGQYPEQMFQACRDIAFLKQLVNKGFSTCYFLMLVNDHRFYEGDTISGIYAYFRGGKAIQGNIQKPTGARDKVLDIDGSYLIKWERLPNEMRYALIKIRSQNR